MTLSELKAKAASLDHYIQLVSNAFEICESNSKDFMSDEAKTAHKLHIGKLRDELAMTDRVIHEKETTKYKWKVTLHNEEEDVVAEQFHFGFASLDEAIEYVKYHFKRTFSDQTELDCDIDTKNAVCQTGCGYAYYVYYEAA